VLPDKADLRWQGGETLRERLCLFRVMMVGAVARGLESHRDMHVEEKRLNTLNR